MNQVNKSETTKDSFVEADYKVCILGVGFVGLTLSMSLTNSRIPVIGVEINPKQVDKYMAGISGMVEPDLDDSLRSAINQRLFKVLSPKDISDELDDCNVYIITVGTPLNNGRIHLAPIISAVNEISKFVKQEDLVIIRSTVSLGTCRKIVAPLLDKVGVKYLLAMCPERTIEGRALQEMRSLPQIIGGADKESAKAAEKFFSVICDESVVVDSLEAAELTKLINNTYRDLMFAFANEVALVANKFGVNASQVIEAANHNYKRSNLAYPGPSGGPCLEKDPWILAESGDSVGLDLKISKAARNTNETFVSAYLRENIVPSNSSTKVAILGLAFKGNPPSTDTRGSLTPALSDEIKQIVPNAQIYGFEPAGEVGDFQDYLTECLEINSILKDAELIVIANNSDSFKDIHSKIKESANPNAVVIDFWGFIKKDSLGEMQILHSWAGEK
jgi:UDP-N-acetyl-D-mannosaminuronic acid dehydrogenase